jgi:hypothetical protein
MTIDVLWQRSWMATNDPGLRYIDSSLPLICPSPSSDKFHPVWESERYSSLFLAKGEAMGFCMSDGWKSLLEDVFKWPRTLKLSRLWFIVHFSLEFSVIYSVLWWNRAYHFAFKANCILGKEECFQPGYTRGVFFSKTVVWERIVFRVERFHTPFAPIFMLESFSQIEKQCHVNTSTQHRLY